LNKTQAAELNARLEQARGRPAALFAPLLMGGFGLFLFVIGLIGDGGFLALGIGAFLIWQAMRALARAGRTLANSAGKQA